ncbi:MAG: hypothetical protein DMG60_20525 [Acidobacteria bacterium]|nr:MAG: hypothetical protein DMG60_20525 [Acidobacteriota bacterium]
MDNRHCRNKLSRDHGHCHFSRVLSRGNLLLFVDDSSANRSPAAQTQTAGITNSMARSEG